MLEANRFRGRLTFICIVLALGISPPAAIAQPAVQPRGIVARFGNDAYRGRSEAGLIFLPDNKTIVTNAGYCDAATGAWIRRFPAGKDEFGSIRLSPLKDRFATTRSDFHRAEGEYRAWIDFWSLTGELLSSWQCGEPNSSEGLQAWTPDGKAVITASRNRVCVRDVETGELRASRTFEKTDLKRIDVSPDGNVLAVNGWMDMWFWNWKTNQPPERLPQVKRGGTGGAFSPDGKLYAADHGFSFGVSLIEVETRKIVRSLALERSHTEAANLLFSEDGTRLYAPQLEEGIAVWNVATGELDRKLPSQGGMIMAIAMSADGRWLAGSSRSSSSVAVWDLVTGKAVAGKATGHRDQILTAAFSKDGSRIASGSADGTIRLWDPATGIERRSLAEEVRFPTQVEFSPDGRRLAVLSFGKGIQVLEVDSGRVEQTLAGHGQVGGRGSILRFSDDGRLLTSVGANLRWQVQNIESGTVVEQQPLAEDPTKGDFRDPGDVLQPLSVEPTDSVIGISNQKLFFTINARTLDRGVTMKWPGRAPRVVASPNSGTVAAIITGPSTETPLRDGRARSEASEDHVLWMFELKAGKPIRQIPLPRNVFPDCVFSPDGTRIAVACSGWRGPLVLIDATTGKELGRAEGELVNGFCTRFSPDGSHLLTASQLGTMTLWDVGRLEAK